ncbi:MAG TPA: NosD domain-containing protein [Pyrinomonadaceae bacterium]|jgi:parallel beta-helix repeat protein
MSKRTIVTATLICLLAQVASMRCAISAQVTKSRGNWPKVSYGKEIHNLTAPVDFFSSFVPTKFSSPVAAFIQGAGLRPITNPTTITESGSYVLLRDIALGAPGTAIVIAADNVSLNLNGHALIGPGNKQGVGVAVEGVSGVSVHDGMISGFGTCVSIVNAHNVRAESLQIRGEDGGGPPPGEVGVLVLNSRGVVLRENTISRTFLGIFVRGGGSGGNRISANTITGGQNGQIGICYNPDGSSNPAGPKGDLVYNNLISRFNIGIQTSIQTLGNIFRENNIAFFQQAINEVTPGSNVFEENTAIAITP